jgi:hypothetical protein
MAAATVTGTCTGDADTIMGGTGAAATTGIAIIDKLSLDSLIVIPLPGRQANCSGANGSRPRKARPVQRAPDGSARSAEPHLHRDPDQVRMILGAELLLEQRGGVGHRLVGNLERIGDFDDLVAAA